MRDPGDMRTVSARGIKSWIISVADRRGPACHRQGRHAQFAFAFFLASAGVLVLSAPATAAAADSISGNVQGDEFYWVNVMFDGYTSIEWRA